MRIQQFGHAVVGGAASIALAALGLVAGASPASAAGFIPVNTENSLVNLNSGLCLDVSGGSYANGAPVIQWACHGGDNQEWTYTSRGELINMRSGKCLDIPWGQGAGAGLVQWDCNGGQNQKWRSLFSDGSHGGGWIVNPSSNLVVDMPGWSRQLGVQATLWHHNNGANQIWAYS
ncbi:RICIN domain-containing protein [Streptomyces sp. NPDC048603]|uniref:RICIN domain-containing protein n=1 Tax=Streptomyces sp. NPDC048603 TaxID=3365577 RepID=UPI0037188E8D